MMVPLAWIVLAAIHALPALALFRPSLIVKMYGAEAGSNVFLLLHHRAALFLMILLLCIWAAIRPEVRSLASVAAGISMLSFLFLYWTEGAPPALRSIAVTDLIGIPFLALVSWQAVQPG